MYVRKIVFLYNMECVGKKEAHYFFLCVFFCSKVFPLIVIFQETLFHHNFMPFKWHTYHIIKLTLKHVVVALC